MKNTFLILISLLFFSSIILVRSKPLLAATPTCPSSSDPTNLNCQLSIGETVNFTVLAKDEDGNSIVGTPVTYTWTVNASTFGVFTANGSTTWVDTNSTGTSVATFKVAGSATIGTVNVSAAYGGNTVVPQAPYNVTAVCTQDPYLLYGIAGVSQAGANNFQYSTAEVLSTCYTEYKLYEGDGRK